MITIKTPATSANVGPGFDCFGLAFDLYNTFEVELSDQDILENVEERFNNPDNIFLKAYHLGCEAIGIHDHIHAIFHTEIPVSRGLGSSASLICGGLFACSALHNNALSKDQIFQFASQLEGHPDNAAPCIYGGFTASLAFDHHFFTQHLTLDNAWKYTLFVPDFEVSTQKARAILPDSYDRKTSASNGAHAALLIEALRTGDIDLLKISAVDAIHEPYRKQLIHEFDEVKNIVSKYGVFLISGSGSTCLLISKDPVSQVDKDAINGLKCNWKIFERTIAKNGSEVL